MPYKDPVVYRAYQKHYKAKFGKQNDAEYYRKNADKIIKHVAEYMKANPEKVRVWARNSALKKRYGITQEQYEAMLLAQDGHCALCPSVPKTRRLHVDHDHKTKKVRALLCYRCNNFLVSGNTLETSIKLVEYFLLHA